MVVEYLSLTLIGWLLSSKLTHFTVSLERVALLFDTPIRVTSSLAMYSSLLVAEILPRHSYGMKGS